MADSNDYLNRVARLKPDEGNVGTTEVIGSNEGRLSGRLGIKCQTDSPDPNSLPGIAVKHFSTLNYMHLTMFAKPVCDRSIYKLIRKTKYRSIVEIGLQDGTRCHNMIQVAKKYGVTTNVRYTGVDQFDARENAGRKLSLIEMHRSLKSVQAKTQLVPGDIQTAIARIANSHVRTDLIVISAGFDAASLEASWFYFPRMLHSGSRVMIQRDQDGAFECMNRLQIEKLADKQARNKLLAA